MSKEKTERIDGEMEEEMKEIFSYKEGQKEESQKKSTENNTGVLSMKRQREKDEEEEDNKNENDEIKMIGEEVKHLIYSPYDDKRESSSDESQSSVKEFSFDNPDENEDEKFDFYGDIFSNEKGFEDNKL